MFNFFEEVRIIIRLKVLSRDFWLAQKLLFSCQVVSESFVSPWNVAHQASLSMGFLWQEYCNGLPFPPPGDGPDLGIIPVFLALAGKFFTTEPQGSFGPSAKTLQFQYRSCWFNPSLGSKDPIHHVARPKNKK